MKILIRHGEIITATDRYTGDIYIEGGKIRAIGENLKGLFSVDREIDAGGLYVFPGGIDAHTHMDMPFMGTCSSDDFETGTAAGLAGGTTAIIDFAIQTQGHTMTEAYNQWMERAQGKAVGDFAFHMAVTDFNAKTLPEVAELMQKGVTSFKTFTAYKGALMLDDRMLFGLMQEVQKRGGLVTVHAENGDMIDDLVQAAIKNGQTAPRYHYLTRPAIAEAEAGSRVMDLAHQSQCPLYIVHTTCRDALERVKRNYLRDQRIYVETCSQYLLLDDSLYEKPGFEGAKWVMSPPLRKKDDQEALWASLAAGHIHTVATDHCPFNFNTQKQAGKETFTKIPNGAPGVQHRVELLFSEGVLKNRLTLNRFVEVIATAPAKIFGLFPRKGTIAVGTDADIVLFDPKAKHTISAKTHKHRVDYSAYEGWDVTGKVVTVLKGGNVAYENGKLDVTKGQGQYLTRQAFHHI
jgi:dihydropyrimidinase